MDTVAHPQTHTKRLCIHVNGIVQGVGFRPTVYQLAKRLKLTGWVRNTADGVWIEIQGERASEFSALLKENAPPLARIAQLESTDIPVITDETLFSIKQSTPGLANTQIGPDNTVCEDCLKDFFNPNSRFYHYPFVTCTHCGPRYSITTELPYDRKQTTMRDFPMCNACTQDYTNPLNRRYHAEPIACPACGPKYSSSIDEMISEIQAGNILAIKGLGGYQLICDAFNQASIQTLRERKTRPSKPFAIMIANTKVLNQFAIANTAEIKLLNSCARPIVLLNKKPSKLAINIAPNLNTIGIMLPSTPLHHLLFNALGSQAALIVTSANTQGNPLIKENNYAQAQLASIADKIIHYNRDIKTRVDDSVARVINKQNVFIRRARGFTPTAIELPSEIPATLALGADLKNTVCVTRGNQAFVSQHIGDLNTKATRQFFHETISHLLTLLNIKPECIAHDMHSDFYTTQIADSFKRPIFAIQHHHAHLGATAVDQNIKAPCLGLALDGFGQGEDNTIWGGELLLYQGTTFKRLSQLKPIAQPGGDIAAREPWRMAASILQQLNKSNQIAQRFKQHPQCDALQTLLEKNIHCPRTSSTGRLFDAASALLGVCDINHFEGEAAMQLESLVTEPAILNSGWKIEKGQLNLLPLFEHLLQCKPVQGANVFHGTLARALSDWIAYWHSHSANTILFGGGCFINRVLSECLMENLQAQGLQGILPSHIPVNDGGLSLGQAWIAGNQLCV